jgi:hypothetical protein
LYTFSILYRNIWGLTVVSDTQFAVVVSAVWFPNKYQLCMFNLSGNELHVQWYHYKHTVGMVRRGDGVGQDSTSSSLYDGEYLAVGSNQSVFHTLGNHTEMIGLDRPVEHSKEDVGETVQKAKQSRLCAWRGY